MHILRITKLFYIYTPKHDISPKGEQMKKVILMTLAIILPGLGELAHATKYYIGIAFNRDHCFQVAIYDRKYITYEFIPDNQGRGHCYGYDNQVTEEEFGRSTISCKDFSNDRSACMSHSKCEYFPASHDADRGPLCIDKY